MPVVKVRVDREAKAVYLEFFPVEKVDGSVEFTGSILAAVVDVKDGIPAGLELVVRGDEDGKAVVELFDRLRLDDIVSERNRLLNSYRATFLYVLSYLRELDLSFCKVVAPIVGKSVEECLEDVKEKIAPPGKRIMDAKRMACIAVCREIVDDLLDELESKSYDNDFVAMLGNVKRYLCGE